MGELPMCGWSSDVVVETEFRHRGMLERPDDLVSWEEKRSRCVSTRGHDGLGGGKWWKATFLEEGPPTQPDGAVQKVTLEESRSPCVALLPGEGSSERGKHGKACCRQQGGNVGLRHAAQHFLRMPSSCCYATLILQDASKQTHIKATEYSWSPDKGFQTSQRLLSRLHAQPSWEEWDIQCECVGKPVNHCCVAKTTEERKKKRNNPCESTAPFHSG
ncbi:hypothetical protein EYF80_004595 [Liparis tanakae]|uniref:Uncharacterized protein n=1 Tax=Liparis tanakae TaxID=230148 RepID=A0A4Z2J4G6_9TELE|nr:hypothetical protein EYF80_004595 [Liparis tanakae]